jgi:hypothetical protein
LRRDHRLKTPKNRPFLPKPDLTLISLRSTNKTAG